MHHLAQLSHHIPPVLGGFATLIFLGACMRVMELRAPIDEKMPSKAIITDWALAGLSLSLPELFVPLAGVTAAFIVNAAGGGLIKLRTDGPWYFVSLIVLVVAIDLYKYWWHRAQHAVPFLWELHSFHHSAEAVTFITGARHVWIERVLVAALLPIIPIIFKAPPSIYIPISVIFMADTCAHTNVRVDFGRAVTWINNPQWHRIHHSTQPEHRDKNFAALLPLWDLLFGTAWIPQPNEYPAAGLVPGEKVGLLEGVIWPVRKHLRRRRPAASS